MEIEEGIELIKKALAEAEELAKRENATPNEINFYQGRASAFKGALLFLGAS